MNVNLKFLKGNVNGSDRDRDVSTIVSRAFLSRTFPSILLTSNSMVSHADECNLPSLKNSLVHVISKLHSRPCYYLYIACGLLASDDNPASD